jgi:hypothetical protein
MTEYTPVDLDAARKLADAIDLTLDDMTAAPWNATRSHCDSDDWIVLAGNHVVAEVYDIVHNRRNVEDAALNASGIVVLRNRTTELTAHVRALAALVERMTEELAEARADKGRLQESIYQYRDESRHFRDQRDALHSALLMIAFALHDDADTLRKHAANNLLSDADSLVVRLAAAEERERTLREALALAKSMILSGEQITPKAADIFRGALSGQPAKDGEW